MWKFMHHISAAVQTIWMSIRSLVKRSSGESAFQVIVDLHDVNPAQLVVSIRHEDKIHAFKEVLAVTKFFDDVEREWKSSGKERSEYLIVIKPNFMVSHTSNDPSAQTDPELVHHLIAQLRARDFTAIKVVESRNVLGKWYSNRDVRTVAKVTGYTGMDYEIVDLSDEAEPYDFGGAFGKDFVGRTWKDADYRISFAKNKTHPANRYTLALKNLFGVTTAEDKYLEYHKKKEWDDTVIEMYRAFPVHFGFIDAFISADQAFGFRGDKSPLHTKTILGGKNIIALDWLGACKMGLDPMESRLMRKAVKEWGRPSFAVYGDVSHYRDWNNTPFLLDAVDDILEEANIMHHFLTHAIMFEPDPVFREKDSSFFKRIRQLLQRS